MAKITTTLVSTSSLELKLDKSTYIGNAQDLDTRIDVLENGVPTDYSKIVYVNALTPTIATIFDLNNPPTINDNLLKIDINNLYIGSDASTWVYNSSTLTYITKTIQSLSNFYLTRTTTDAGNTKTENISRIGSISASNFIGAGTGLTGTATSLSIEGTASTITGNITESQVTGLVTDLASKVDKVTGKSLISDTEITRLAGVSNVDISGKVDKVTGERLINALEITKLSNQSGTNTGDQDLSGKENTSNKQNSLAVDGTGVKFPTVDAVNSGLNLKVDKVAGKSLILDTEITRLGTLANYTHPTNHPPSIITQDVSNRFVTDAEKATWNAKQNDLGFTPENTANKNIASGYAGLGADGKLISSQLPSITISDTYVVASQAEMLGLTLADKGDVAVRTDLNKSFILKGNLYSTLTDWQELLTPTSAVTTVFGRNGAVTAQTGDYTATQVGAPSGSGNSTGTNTGDETLSTIKTKLGITTLSGSNTGDQDISSKENTVNKQNSLAIDGTGVKFPTVDAINSGLALKVDKVTGKSLISDTEITRLAGVSNVDISGKVDKVTGKSLILDTEITRLATLANYTHPANHPPSIITQDVSNRFVTDAEKVIWNGKQSALGFTPENTANKNIASGYAGLGVDGKLIYSQLPSITISDTFVTVSQATMLALIAQTGDISVRTDLNKSFILKGTDPTLLSDWQELLTPTSAVTTVFGRNGGVVAQTNDYNADQIGETATRVFQTPAQRTNNDATSSIQTQLNGKQPTLVSNTNIKTVGGTTVLGTGDIALPTLSSLGAAPATGSANYIQNQNASTQSANMWVNGNGTFGDIKILRDVYQSIILDRSINVNSPTLFSMGITYDVPNNDFFRLGHQVAGVGQNDFTVSKTGAATFSSSVTATGAFITYADFTTLKGASNTIGGGSLINFGNGLSGASNRQTLFQLNASNGLDLWHFNGSSYVNTGFKLNSDGSLNGTTATFASSVTATSLIKSGGTSSQFLKADGSVDSTVYGTGSGTVTSVTGTNGVTVATGTTTPVIGLGAITPTSTNGVSAATMAYVDATSSIQTQLNGKQASGSYETAFTKNTAFNKNFGTIAGTVVEGGTLGSNAYNSTAYLPLTGGTLSGALNGTSATFSSSVTSASHVTTGGIASQFVKGDGSLDATVYAPLDSPSLSGTPTAPTATAGTNTTQIATTAFVLANPPSNAVLLTGNQSITGEKTFTGGIISGNSSTGIGISSSNTSIGTGFYSGNSSTGIGLYSANDSTGTGFFTYNTSSGKGVVINNTTAATGIPFTIQKNGVDKLTITDNGGIQAGAATFSSSVTATALIKSGGTSSQFLMADGSTSTAGTAPIQLKDFYPDSAANIGINETDLLTYTIGTNRLNAPGEKLVAIYGGIFNDATATSQLRVYYAGSVIADTGALTMSVTGAWIVNVSIIRTGATTARAMVNISTPGASTASYTNYTPLTGLTFSASAILKITGTANGATGGNGDINATYGNIIWQPAAL